MADLVEVIQSEHFYEQFQIALSLLEQIEARLATIDARLARIEAVARSTEDPDASRITPRTDNLSG